MAPQACGTACAKARATKDLGIFQCGQRQRQDPGSLFAGEYRRDPNLCAMDRTTEGSGSDRDQRPQYRRHRSRVLRCSRHPGFPVHSGQARLLLADPPLEHDTYERLQSGDLAQAATVEAIFVYNTAMRDQMLPRKPLPHPELEEQRKAPLKKLMPGEVEVEEKTKGNN